MGSKKNKGRLDILLGDNKFLLLISFLLACVFWILTSQSMTQETTTTISDVPVIIELSKEATDAGLKIYSGNEITVSVEIEGNRLSVGAVTKKDLQVVALGTSSVTAPGSYSLTLSARKNNLGKQDYTIKSFSPTLINNVVVDKEREKEFTIENKVDISDAKIPEGNYVSRPVLSKDKVTITGPESEIKKIARVVVRDKITGNQDKTITANESIVMLDDNGEEITSSLLIKSLDTVDATIQILPTKEIPITPIFVNLPTGIDVDSIVKVTPATITIAGSKEDLDKVTEIKLESIDFAKISPTATPMVFAFAPPTGCISIGTADTATVTFDLKNYTYKTIDIADTDISNVGLQPGYTVSVESSSVQVSIAGPTDILAEVTGENVKVTADLSSLSKDFDGPAEVPVKIKITGADKCWSFKEYIVMVKVTKIKSNS
ncbi:hypothetical protein AGMMS50284_3700 [Clostridia bacterium]|nr:hypothetical protein AGMMS50284_3700 [Clostridia bacterium]